MLADPLGGEAKLRNRLDAYPADAAAGDLFRGASDAVTAKWHQVANGMVGRVRSGLRRDPRTGWAARFCDLGLTFRIAGDEDERDWPLTPMPLIVGAEEWAGVERGLIQRARLLEAVLADVYGSADLVRRGRISATLVAGNPEFIRPIAGSCRQAARTCGSMRSMSGGNRRALVGARRPLPGAVGRGLCVGKPVGACSRFADIYRELHVCRLAPFFRDLQAELSSLSRRDDARVCVLTPGAMNETYFEHAYLARYLGFLLAEGEDLTVRSDGVFIRTVSGLQRTEVLSASRRCRLRRSARAECAFAPGRRAGAGAGGARPSGRHREFPRLRAGGGARRARLSACARTVPPRRDLSPFPTSPLGGWASPPCARRWPTVAG